jgi:hypothetical protein
MILRGFLVQVVFRKRFCSRKEGDSEKGRRAEGQKIYGGVFLSLGLRLRFHDIAR